MGKAREFTTVPVRAIADTRLTALELRVLLVIALHDGMSTMKGTGPGCYARSATLAPLARTDITRFSRSVSRLIKLGYVVKEAQEHDRRRFTLRVLYGDDNSWRVGQLSADAEPAEMVDELVNDRSEMVDEFANYQPEIVDEGELKNGRNPRLPGPHYISLNEELDSVKLGTRFSETAQRENFAPRHQQENASESDLAEPQKDPAEAGYAGGVSILARLTKHFAKLGPEAQLCRFEDEFRAIGRDVGALPAKEREHWTRWLLLMAGGQDAMEGSQAWRLYEEVASCPSAPADLSLVELRRWTKATIDVLGYGGQTRLAEECGVPPSTLHGFRHGKPLPGQHWAAVRNACARVLPFCDWKARAA